MKLTWNVYRYNLNSRKIETYIIFNHGGFESDVRKAIDKHEDKELFAKEVKSSLMYYFWSKSEWEILICPWSSFRDTELKIDVYDQVMLNWEEFINYIWRQKNDGRKNY